MAKKKKNSARKAASIDGLKDPLLAAVGVLDLALQQLDETIDVMRERAGEARSDASTSAERTRERLTKRRQELREQLNAEELRNAYQTLTERGEAVLVRLRERTSKESSGAKT